MRKKQKNSNLRVRREPSFKTMYIKGKGDYPLATRGDLSNKNEKLGQAILSLFSSQRTRREKERGKKGTPYISAARLKRKEKFQVSFVSLHMELANSDRDTFFQ
jgi:hypothetical protein